MADEGTSESIWGDGCKLHSLTVGHVSEKRERARGDKGEGWWGEGGSKRLEPAPRVGVYILIFVTRDWHF